MDILLRQTRRQCVARNLRGPNSRPPVVVTASAAPAPGGTATSATVPATALRHLLRKVADASIFAAASPTSSHTRGTSLKHEVAPWPPATATTSTTAANGTTATAPITTTTTTERAAGPCTRPHDTGLLAIDWLYERLDGWRMNEDFEACSPSPSSPWPTTALLDRDDSAVASGSSSSTSTSSSGAGGGALDADSHDPWAHRSSWTLHSVANGFGHYPGNMDAWAPPRSSLQSPAASSSDSPASSSADLTSSSSGCSTSASAHHDDHEDDALLLPVPMPVSWPPRVPFARAYSPNSELTAEDMQQLLPLLELNSESVLLEVGCGRGKFVHNVALNASAHLVAGLEPDASAVAAANSVSGTLLTTAPFLVRSPFVVEHTPDVAAFPHLRLATHVVLHSHRLDGASVRRLVSELATVATGLQVLMTTQPLPFQPHLLHVGELRGSYGSGGRRAPVTWHCYAPSLEAIPLGLMRLLYCRQGYCFLPPSPALAPRPLPEGTPAAQQQQQQQQPAAAPPQPTVARHALHLAPMATCMPHLELKPFRALGEPEWLF